MITQLTNDELNDFSKIFEDLSKTGLDMYRFISEVQKKGLTITAGEQERAGEALVEYAKTTPFVWQGNISDLSAFWTTDTIPLEALSGISEDLKKSVVSNFEFMGKCGYIIADDASKTLTITPHGKEYISSTNYIKSVLNDKINMHQDIANTLLKVKDDNLAIGKGLNKGISTAMGAAASTNIATQIAYEALNKVAQTIKKNI